MTVNLTLTLPGSPRIQEPVIRAGKMTRRGLGIIKDDALIHCWDARLDCDPANPRIELRITTTLEGLLL